MKYIFFVKALDAQYEPMAKVCINSFCKFHDKKYIKLLTMKDYVDITGFELDKTKPEPTPTFAKELLKKYDLVVSLDSDQLIMGDLNYIIEQYKNYDLGTVYNLNRVDPHLYRKCSITGVPAEMYYNTGLIAFTNLELVNHFDRLTQYEIRQRFVYGDQDPLNIIAHFFGYKVKCFDDYDAKNNYSAWHGLKAKGEGLKFILKDKQVILPKGPDNYPERDVLIKAYHWAGGPFEKKHNYHLDFKHDMVDHINWLIS